MLIIKSGFAVSAIIAISYAALVDLTPQVILDYGVFNGLNDPITGTNNFLGMPFAVAGRLQNPRVIGAKDKLTGVQDATKYGPACPQQEFIASPLNGNNISAEIGGYLATAELLTIQNITNQAERGCLNINVQVPQNVSSEGKLPVMMWIHGGGFELGSSAAFGAETTSLPGSVYQGANIVARSLQMGQPVVFVSANHRLNAFGTLASEEITEAGVSNLLLKDQRTAMAWVQKYIHLFGGDPERVMLFGESAGSIAIAIHMLLNNGNPDGLFSSAVMLSGGPSKFDNYERGQPTFDAIAKSVGCGSSKAKVKCIRNVPYDALYKAVQEQPTFLSYESTLVPWYPRPDGTYLRSSPHTLLRTGKVAKIPFIIGDMKDEGTVFSLVNQLNVTTDADFQAYFKQVYFPNATAAQIEALTSLYPEDPAAGSPFDTGDLNSLTPQYKRLAALIGDYTFQAPRRDLLNYRSALQPAYTYQIEDSLPLLGQIGILGSSGLNLAAFPALGSFHVSDVLLYAFANVPATVSRNTLNLMSTLISFANSHDPNNHGVAGLPYWPRYETGNRSMFLFEEDGPSIISDTYREEAMDFINANGDVFSY